MMTDCDACAGTGAWRDTPDACPDCHGTGRLSAMEREDRERRRAAMRRLGTAGQAGPLARLERRIAAR